MVLSWRRARRISPSTVGSIFCRARTVSESNAGCSGVIRISSCLLTDTSTKSTAGSLHRTASSDLFVLFNFICDRARRTHRGADSRMPPRNILRGCTGSEGIRAAGPHAPLAGVARCSEASTLRQAGRRGGGQTGRRAGGQSVVRHHKVSAPFQGRSPSRRGEIVGIVGARGAAHGSRRRRTARRISVGPREGAPTPALQKLREFWALSQMPVSPRHPPSVRRDRKRARHARDAQMERQS